MMPIAGGFSARNLSVIHALPEIRVQGKPWEIVGGPGWLTTDGYAVEAYWPISQSFIQEKPEMLRPLLADRFQLKFPAKRTVPICSLTVAKNGPKLQATAAGVRGFIRPGRGLIEA